MDMSERLERVRERIAAACDRCGRDVDEVTLVAVSKTHEAPAIHEAADLGLRIFGESKVQELKKKMGRCPSHINWHLIGHLQSNKAREAVSLFKMIHSVDSVSLAEELNKHAEKQARMVPILLQVNVSMEATKFGFRPEEFLEAFDKIIELPRLEVHGLMTMAPWTKEIERTRPAFSYLREIRDEAAEHFGAPLPELSMGMSNDFEIAIEEGATLIRVGSDLFGRREYGSKK